MKRHALQSAVALAWLSLVPAAQATPAYALSTGPSGHTLVRFDTAHPELVTAVGALSGDTSSLDGLDFRPADGFLYGYLQNNAGLYRVNPATGVTTLVGTSSAPVTSESLGIDFNPAADRLRVVTAGDENRRINVTTGATLSDGTLAYAATDPNAGVDPNLIEAAYTNNDVDPATGTTLYYLDSLLDVLVSTTNPNGGVLSTVGALGVDADDFMGFDIFTDPQGINSAFASLRVGRVQGLYRIDLGSGAATLVGGLGADSLRGLAIATVPEPGTVLLVASAALALLGRRRRIRRL